MSLSARNCQRRLRILAAAAAAGAVGVTASPPKGYGQLEVAENLLVNIDATGLPAGPASSVPNTGTLAGFFEPRGTAEMVPVIGPPLPAATSGTRGIRLDGNDFLQHVQSMGGPLLPAPAGLVGVNPTRSIEAWVWNPAIAGEETMVSWGRRGGPAGTNMSFNYGTDPNFGAVGHWGAPDIGWVPTGPGAPAARQWHHLVYTFDGSTTRVYADGTLANSETPVTLNTHTDPAPLPINIGTQVEPVGGGTPTGGLRGSLTLGRVRVHDGVLTDAQIAANYALERANFTDPALPPPPTPAPLARPPVHRYSFNNPTGDATNSQVTDSIGNQHGTVLGPGATWSGTRLVLPGGPSATAPYVDLPNGLLSKFGAGKGGPGQVTIEGWARHTGSQSWSRFFDFGASIAAGGADPLEFSGPGGAGTGLEYAFLSAQVGGNTAAHQLEVRDDTNNPGEVRMVQAGANTFNTDLHFVVTWDEATGQLRLYEQGLLSESLSSPVAIGFIEDINNMLGRSNWTADANFQGQFDEFRLYDRVLTPEEIQGNFQAGADVVTPEPSSLWAAALTAGGLLLRRRAQRQPS